MSDPNVETGQGAGAEGTPNSPVSPQSQPSIEGNVAELITALEGKFSEQFTSLSKELRGLQSRQDKSDNSFQQQLARLEQLTSKGMSKEEALSTMQKEDSESTWRANLEKQLQDLASLVQGGGTPATAQQKTAETFAKLGLDTQDPRVAPFLAKQYPNAEAMELAAYRLKDELSKSPSPSSAQSASLQGGANTPVNVNELTAEYDRLSKNPSAKGNMKRMAEIQEELDKIN